MIDFKSPRIPMVPFFGLEELEDAFFKRQYSVERWRPPTQKTPSTFH